MDEIDNIILHSLRQIGCDIDESSTLGQLNPESVVKCVSRCLWSIDATLDVPTSMPKGMSQKYGVTMALAEACTKIGFRGDLGYQTFLYPNNIAELRRVLMFLIDRLPRDEGDATSHQAKELTGRQKSDAEMRQSLSIALKSNRKMVPISRALEFKRLEYSAAAEFDPQKSVYSQTTPGNIWSTLITNNDSGTTTDYGKMIRIRSKKATAGGLKSSASTSSLNLDKSKGDDESSSLRVDEETIEDIPEEEKVDPVEQRLLKIGSIRSKIELKREEREKIVERIEEFKRKSKLEKDKLDELKMQKRIKERTLLVLENPDENIQKLQKMIDNSKEKMNKLQDQWFEHKTPLQVQIEKINLRKAAQADKSKVFEDQIRESRQKQNIIRQEMNAKSQLYSELLNDLGKVNQKIDRSAYTSRILEIIGNIRKQKTDIDKILRDTRDVQKDINTATGKLERQFTVTDDLLFGNAKRDEATKKAYKLFLKAHADCGELSKSIQDTGKISREIRDLEEQIENGKTRSTSSNLKQVSQDLEEMQSENNKLFEQILQYRQDTKNYQ